MPHPPGWLPGLLLVGAIAPLAACSSPAARFVPGNAAAHVRMLADTIGSRPSGTDANRRAREYVIEQVRRFGFEVRVQEADGVRPLHGATAHVRNIIATRPGRRPYAIALVSHYDSVPDGPGAADAALGVAVCLEAGRVLAARPAPNYALALVFTDGEEFGLMGASALLKDPIVGWMRAVLNFESIGAAGPALLFEAAPGSGAIVDAWRRTAWRPAGAAFMTDIYRHLPSDTDLTLFKRAGLAGVNFAPAGDSYAYHTPRDSTARLNVFTVAQMGENAVATAEALDDLELSERQPTPSTYFDIARVRAFAYSRQTEILLLAAALLAGLFAWIQAAAVARDEAGLGCVALTVVYTMAAVAASVGTMLGATWLLRATRESYHPWHAHPGRFYLFLLLVGAFGAWVAVQMGRWLPLRWRGSLEPAVLWVIILPCWVALALALQLTAPSAAFLAVLPLMATSAAIVVFSLRRTAPVVVGVVALAVSGIVWLPDAWLLLRFVVALLGRVPVITPLVVYPALLVVCGLFIVPPLVTIVAAFAAGVGLGRGAARLATSAGPILAAAVVLSCAWCWFSPAYTDERPLQKTVRYVNDLVTRQSYWEVGSNEPGIDVRQHDALGGSWQRLSAPFAFATPLDPPRWPFSYRAPSAAVHAPPVSVKASLECGDDHCTAEIGVTPASEGLVVVFKLPPGVVPEETNLPAIAENGAYRAIYAAVPPTGVTWRLQVPRDDATKIESAQVVAVSAGLPGAAWPRLPAWLPAEHVVWRARSYFAMPVRFDSGAPRSQRGTIN